MTERHQGSGPQSPPRRPPPRLARRSEFLAVAKGQRFQSRSFSLQAMARKRPGATEPGAVEPAAGVARFGFTVTKKIGKAVLRNRIRRRLKEALRLAPDLPARLGHDYVIVARNSALSQSFTALQDELRRALAGLGGQSGAYRGKGKARSGATRRSAERQDVMPQNIENGGSDT